MHHRRIVFFYLIFMNQMSTNFPDLYQIWHYIVLLFLNNILWCHLDVFFKYTIVDILIYIFPISCLAKKTKTNI